MEQRADDGAGGTYGYGLWAEEFDGVRWIAHSGGMVGYTALFAVVPEEGLGCIVLQNGYGEGLRKLARAAFATIRASLAGQELPPAIVPPAATTSPRPPTTSAPTPARTVASSMWRRSAKACA